mgnify:CR=1 FL=1
MSKWIIAVPFLIQTQFQYITLYSLTKYTY